MSHEERGLDTESYKLSLTASLDVRLIDLWLVVTSQEVKSRKHMLCPCMEMCYMRMKQTNFKGGYLTKSPGMILF